MSRSCTTAISRPPARTRGVGTLRVARGRDVALCTVEAAFRTRPHATRYAYTRCRLRTDVRYMLYAVGSEGKNVSCVVPGWDTYSLVIAQ